MSSEWDVAGVAVLGFCIGVYWFLKGFRGYRKYYVLADTPRAPIGSVAMGLVEIHGTAQGEERILSPVTRTPCYFSRVDIDKWQVGPQARGSWGAYAKHQVGVRFYLEDRSGSVLVDTRGAELDLKPYSIRQIGAGMDLGSATIFGQKARAEPDGTEPTEAELLSFIRSLKLDPYSTLSAAGSYEPLNSPREALNQLLGRNQWLRRMRYRGLWTVTKLFRRGSGSSKLRESYRLTEYCILPGLSYDVTGICAENPKPTCENDRIMITKAENEQTFLISHRSETELEGSLRRKAALKVFGGAALMVICLALILEMLRLF